MAVSHSLCRENVTVYVKEIYLKRAMIKKRLIRAKKCSNLEQCKSNILKFFVSFFFCYKSTKKPCQAVTSPLSHKHKMMWKENIALQQNYVPGCRNVLSCSLFSLAQASLSFSFSQLR